LNRYFHNILLLIAFIPVIAIAQKPTITTSVDRNSILIGERIQYHVQTSMPDNLYRISWFNVPDSFGAFVVVSKDKIDSSFSNGNIQFSQSLLLTSFDSGRQTIPALSFQIEKLNGDSTFQMFTDTIPVDVRYSPLDSIMPFHDIKPIIRVPLERDWWKWLIAGLLIILIGLLIYFKTRKKKEMPVSLFDNDLSDYDEAMQALQKLKAGQLPPPSELKSYYFQLAYIFKRYLTRKTNRLQMHLTSDEIIATISEYDFSRETISEFASVLKTGDAVKFAKYRPDVEEVKKAVWVEEKIIKHIHDRTREVKNDI